MTNPKRESLDYAGGYTSDDESTLKVPYLFRGSLMGAEELEAVRRVVESGQTLTAGPEIHAFEQEFATACGAAHAFATSSCTTALCLAHQLAGIGPGDEVISSPLTFVATTLPALHRGAQLVFADIDERTFNLDPEAVRERITPRTRAIVVTHYGGQMADMEALIRIARGARCVLIEDAAHAVGARDRGRCAGACGDYGCFSFHSLKNMSTLGEGGMLTVADEDAAGRVPALRSMGLVTYPDQRDYWLPYHYDVVAPGGELPQNFRLGEVAAAVGRVQLRRLAAFNRRRQECARRLSLGFANLPGLHPPWIAPGAEHVFHLYTLLLAEGGAPQRDAIVRRLYRRHRVQPILHYLPSYRFTLYREKGLSQTDCPVAERVFARLFNLPIHPALTDAQVDTMIAAVRESVGHVLGSAP